MCFIHIFIHILQGEGEKTIFADSSAGSTLVKLNYKRIWQMLEI